MCFLNLQTTTKLHCVLLYRLWSFTSHPIVGPWWAWFYKQRRCHCMGWDHCLTFLAPKSISPSKGLWLQRSIGYGNCIHIVTPQFSTVLFWVRSEVATVWFCQSVLVDFLVPEKKTQQQDHGVWHEWRRKSFQCQCQFLVDLEPEK